MIKVYGTHECGYCKRAKELLDIYGVQYQYFTIGEDVPVSDVKALVPEDWRTVPIVLENDKFIGGFTNLEELLENGSSGYGH